MSGADQGPYRGTAQAYQQHRRRYPDALISAVIERTGLTVHDTVVDVACGTGQVARRLVDMAGRVIAVDAEVDFVRFGTGQEPRIEWRLGRAEELDLDVQADVVTVGNAFHRFDGDAAAKRIWRLLKPSGHLALLWTHTPWVGDAPWQRAMADTIAAWERRVDAPIPDVAPQDPLSRVLARNGFAHHERIEVVEAESWTADALVGFMRSTSFLNERVLGPQQSTFEEDLRTHLAAARPDGRFERHTTAAVDIATAADTGAWAETVLDRIARAARSAPTVVAIDGRSGGGKSTLAADVARRHPSCVVIDGDDFYAGGSEEHWDSLAAEQKAAAGIDWRRQRPVIEALRGGRPAAWHGYDWDRFDGSLDVEPTVCEPADVVILEGAYSARPELADLIDVRVLVDVPEQVRRPRLVARDGDDWHEEWFQRWREAEDHYFGTVVPPSAFDLVLRL